MATSILDSITDLTSYKSVTDRYFSKRFVVNAEGIENNDIMIMFHSNRIALITLAPSHFFFKKTGDFQVNFNTGKIDRTKNTVKGKGKKGGQYLFCNSILCKVEFGNGHNFNVHCGMQGALVEVNDNLIKNPHLLRENPDSDGYIAIVLASIVRAEQAKQDLLTEEEYNKLVCNNVEI